MVGRNVTKDLDRLRLMDDEDEVSPELDFDQAANDR